MAQNETSNVGRPKKSHLFQKGQSGNPKGRPKGIKNKQTLFNQKMREMLNNYLMAGDPTDSENTRLRKMYAKLYEKALSDDKDAFQYMKLLFGEVQQNARHDDRLEAAAQGGGSTMTVKLIADTGQETKVIEKGVVIDQLTED